MRAIFLVKPPHETTLPPMDELQYTNENGELAGGWWVVGEVPLPCSEMVCVDTTDDMLDQMAANPDYLFIEDVTDEKQE
jgi:hypothetical protein